ncbi:hypothetical protein M1349_00815 [Patescibacteria group bacterium]|nr:hypothetical protein [Patescibacteria group bacterium]
MDKTLPDSEEPSVISKSTFTLPPQEPAQSTTSPAANVPSSTPFAQIPLPPDPFDNVPPVNSAAQSPTPAFSSSQIPEPTPPQNMAVEPPPPVPPVPVSVPPPSKKGLPKIFLFAIIIAVIIGIAAAYYVSTMKKTDSSSFTQKSSITPTEIPLPTISPTETATPSPTISQDLKTYTSSRYSFELSYPSTWVYTESTNEYGSIKFSDPNKSIPNSTLGDISITPYKTTLSLSAWIDSGHPFFGKDLKKYYTVKQTTTINENSVTVMTGGNDSIYGKAAYVKSGDYVYEVFLQGTANSINQQDMLNDDVFNKVLLSLKFGL